MVTAVVDLGTGKVREGAVVGEGAIWIGSGYCYPAQEWKDGKLTLHSEQNVDRLEQKEDQNKGHLERNVDHLEQNSDLWWRPREGSVEWNWVAR